MDPCGTPETSDICVADLVSLIALSFSLYSEGRLQHVCIDSLIVNNILDGIATNAVCV